MELPGITLLCGTMPINKSKYLKMEPVYGNIYLTSKRLVNEIRNYPYLPDDPQYDGHYLNILIIRFFRSEEILLGLLLGAVFFIAGIAKHFEFSHLLPIMVFAFYLENFTKSELAHKSYKTIDKIEEPILGVFFLLAGAHLNLSQAFSAGLLVLVVFFARFMGKYGGTWLAANFTGAENKIKKYAGLALFPSAGVAIGLVLDAQSRLSEFIPELTTLMLGIIIGQTLINELISPFFVRFAFKKAGEISR